MSQLLTCRPLDFTSCETQGALNTEAIQHLPSVAVVTVRTGNTKWKAVLILNVSHVAVGMQGLSNGSIMSVFSDNSDGLEYSTSFDGLE